jgi:hypothetical protein
LKHNALQLWQIIYASWGSGFEWPTEGILWCWRICHKVADVCFSHHATPVQCEVFFPLQPN